MAEGPFRRLRFVAMTAAAYAVAAAVWIVSGGDLPGGRWLAVHLFTLGVLTNLVLALTDHFARTLTHRGGITPRWQLPLTNAAIVTVLWAITANEDAAVALGASVLAAVVLASWVRLLRLRRGAVGARFDWVVRMYERAHAAFLVGAVLGALVGTGAVSGEWALAARTAHLHVNLLGWAGLTLLATVVFFGPTIARIRIEQGADVRAARALPLAALALALAVLALLGTGAEGGVGVALRIAAGAGLGVYAWAVATVAVPVVGAMRRSTFGGRWGVGATAIWFGLVAIADAVVVAFGSARGLEAVGVAMLVGVLAQAIVSSLGYLAPMLRERGPARDATLARLERSAAARAAAWNAGVVLLVVGAAAAPSAGDIGGWITRIGWTLVLASAATLALSVVGFGRGTSEPADDLKGDR